MKDYESSFLADFDYYSKVDPYFDNEETVVGPSRTPPGFNGIRGRNPS